MKVRIYGCNLTLMLIIDLMLYGKTRYKGLAKNDAQLNVLFVLSNLYMVREKLRR